MTLDKQYLYSLGFVQPTIKPASFGGMTIKKELIDGNEFFYLLQDGVRWMAWNRTTHKEVFELYTHHHLAKGHCICTGLGFGLREKWLLSKQDVTKITVIEKNKNIIEYHRQFNPDLMERIEVVCCDVYEYKGECDTLLIDNFEGSPIEHEYSWLCSIQHISQNIKHDVMWAWPLEGILSLHYRNYIGLTLFELYTSIKKYFDLHTLPDLTEHQLLNYCNLFFMGNYDVCDFTKINK